MPETERKLVLHSPASSEYVEYRWPLNRTETWDEAVEIVETIRWVCRDFPDLKLAVEKFVLNSFEPTSFESMKQLCERYNRAVANIKKLWSGRQPPPGIDAPPSIPLLRHIINQAYNRAVTKPEELNSYEPFSPEVYGETSFELVCEVMKHTKMTENDVFVDLGSGIGQVVLQVAAKVGCKCYGVEKAEIPGKFAESMEEEFVRWMDWYGKSYGEFELMKGDFLDPEFDEILQSASVIFTNNFAFGPKLNHELKLKFANLKDGTKIVSSHEFCPLNFRITPRNMSDIGSIMHVAELSPLKGSVSWTGKHVSYYLHTIDRGRLEKFYLRQKHPEEYKSESSSRSGTTTSEESCSESSSESDDDNFKSALERIQLPLYASGAKKARDYHNPSLRRHKKSKQLLLEAAKPGGHHMHRKSRWHNPPHLKDSSGMSSSAVSSPGLVNIDGLFSCFHNQLEAYMGQLGTPYFQQWIVDAIEKEKMKKSHLQGVINHLESEVAGLSKETVEQMKENMKELGIRKMTPDGLLLGAKSIVSQNKQLRKEMTDLEREITTLREQNKAMEVMCMHNKSDPKRLPKLPLFGPEGEVLTNGITSPCHMTPSCNGEPQPQVSIAELKEAKLLSVEECVTLSTLDPKHLCAGLVKEYEIELERIDQQLLELGPYAQDAYDDEEDPQLLVSAPPPDVRKGKKGKPVVQHKVSRRPSRVLDDFSDPQRGSWRAVSGGWGEISDRRADEKELPKNKWRKVGSAGPSVRGKEGQLDAQSDPLNVSSANIIITPASDLEMRALYQPPPGIKKKSTQSVDGDTREGLSPAHVTHTLDQQTGVNIHVLPNDLPGGSVSTTAHSTPSCNTNSPSDSDCHARTQPTAHWKPVSGGAHKDYPNHGEYTHHKHSYAHLPQQVSMDTSGTSEEVDVTRVESEESPLAAAARRGDSSDPFGGYEAHQGRRAAHGSKPSHRSDSISGRSDIQTPSPKTTVHGQRQAQPNQPAVNLHSVSQHQHAATGIPKQPGFSISHLARGPDSSTAYDAHSLVDHSRGPLPSSERSVASPSSEVESVQFRKRRTSSSSSHRSTRLQSIDDNALARSGSPVSASHPRGQYVPGVMWESGAGVHSPSPKDKLPTVGSSDGKIPGMIPFSMWPPGVPVPTDTAAVTAQLQRYPLSSPFLAASNPWLRGGMIPGLPFRPALYPAGAAAASLDPNNPYKPMLSLPLYPFTPAGLKGPFPTPAFSTPSSVPNSQPQTPSSVNPGFPFGQYSIPQTGSMSASALREAQNRLSNSSAQLVQHPSFAVGKETGQRSSPESNQDTPQQQPWSMIPGMSMLQAPFGFGVQNPLSASVTQQSQLNLLTQRGPVVFSTSPLTLSTQSAVAVGSGSAGDVQHAAVDAFHQASAAGRRTKKQSGGAAIDLTGRDKHIEAPSPQEAVKMATQRISPFQDPSRFSPKLKSVPEAASVPPSSSPLVPTYVTNPSTLSTQAQGQVLSYPGVPGHLINPSQLMGVALSGSHMIPMNYPGMPNLNGKVEDGSGKKRSPKRGGAQKLRIHQMDFKQQGKVDRRRRRPLKLPEKQLEEMSMVPGAATKPAASAQATVAGQPSSTQSSSDDNYALNMLADCSSKEGEKTNLAQATVVAATAQQTQELANKRALMRSPGSIAGANSLLLLAKPEHVPPSGSSARRESPPEHAVVDSLLRLSNSPVPATSTPQDKLHASVESQSGPASESCTQSTAAEAILMIGQGRLDSGGGEDGTKRGEVLNPPSEDGRHVGGGEEREEVEREDADSEKTDTDSEATLSPTTPAPTSMSTCRWPKGAQTALTGVEIEKTSSLPKPPQEFVKPTSVPPSKRALEIELHPPPQTSNYSEPSTGSTVQEDNHTMSADTLKEVAPSSFPATRTVSSSPAGQSEEPLSAVESTANELKRDGIAENPVPPVEQGKVAETQEMQSLTETREERELLDLGPPSSRLEMIEDEEDADVDVENIDSSLLNEPEPATVSPQSTKSPVLTAPSSVLGAQLPSPPPEIVPSSPETQESVNPVVPPTSPPPSLRADTPPPVDHKEDEVVEEMQQNNEKDPLASSPLEKGDETGIDSTQPPPKRLRLEENEGEVVRLEKEMEEGQLEAMETETSQSPLPAVHHPLPLPSPAKIATPVTPPSDVVVPSAVSQPHSHSPPLATDVEQSEQTTALSEDETKLTTADDFENTTNSQLCSVSEDGLLPPANFENIKQVPLTTSEAQDEAQPRVEAVTHPDEISNQPDLLPTSPTEMGETSEVQGGKMSPEMDSSAAPGGADSPTTCMSWTAEPEKQVFKTSPEPKAPTPTSSPVPIEKDGAPSDDACTKTRSRSSSPRTDGEQIATAAVKTGHKNPNCVPESENQQFSPDNTDKTIVKTNSTGDSLLGPSNVVRRPSPPAVPQNRLPVHKSGFERHLQHRKLVSHQHTHKQHSRDEKSSQSKKSSRAGDPGSRVRGLFDVDPQESWRQKTDNRTSEREASKHASEGRKVKPRPPPPVHGHSNKDSTERTKHNRPPQNSNLDDLPHGHSKPQDGSQVNVWEQRESSSKQKVRPLGRQGSRFSPLPPPAHVTNHSPGHVKDCDDIPSLSEEDQQGRGGGRGRGHHQNSHGWREDRQSPTDHGRDRGHKHKGHRTDSTKHGFEDGRKIARTEKEKEQQRKHVSMADASSDERMAVFKRHRGEDNSDHSSATRLKISSTRKRSYESVSEDELPEESNCSSSRESSLVAEDRMRSEHRSSLEAAEQRGSVWRKESKRSVDGSSEDKEFSRISKHKKHKHGSREHKERRKWRKTTDGNDSKMKRSNEENPWLSFHKH